MSPAGASLPGRISLAEPCGSWARSTRRETCDFTGSGTVNFYAHTPDPFSALGGRCTATTGCPSLPVSHSTRHVQYYTSLNNLYTTARVNAWGYAWTTGKVYVKAFDGAYLDTKIRRKVVTTTAHPWARESSGSCPPTSRAGTLRVSRLDRATGAVAILNIEVRFVAPTPTPAATPTATPTATSAATPTANPTATPTAALTGAPTPTPTATPTARPPTPTPTATPMAGTNCCNPHMIPGCNDLICETVICGIDSFCCDFEWDKICVSEANTFCPVCGTSDPHAYSHADDHSHGDTNRHTNRDTHADSHADANTRSTHQSAASVRQRDEQERREGQQGAAQGERALPKGTSRTRRLADADDF